jgi:hypothetical protein
MQYVPEQVAQLSVFSPHHGLVIFALASVHHSWAKAPGQPHWLMKHSPVATAGML